jgi:hypothetical protein
LFFKARALLTFHLTVFFGKNFRLERLLELDHVPGDARQSLAQSKHRQATDAAHPRLIASDHQPENSCIAIPSGFPDAPCHAAQCSRLGSLHPWHHELLPFAGGRRCECDD